MSIRYTDNLHYFRSYSAAVLDCLDYGKNTPSRVGGMDSLDVGLTRELHTFTYEYTPGDEVRRPGYSRKLALLEALHLLSGTFDAEHFKAVSPKVGTGMFTPQMAYGPRAQPHFERTAKELLDNPHSRRAIIFISDNEAWPPPCTNSIQFLLRGGVLYTTVSMRSWDLWLGLPYDTFMFGTLALAMAGAIHAKPGFVRVQATSAHLYEKHLEKAREAAMDGRLENRLGAYDLSSRGWARLGDENDNTRYWGGVKHVADVSLEYCPWAGPAVDWEKVQKSGLVRFV